jgi:hypothetical protein
VDHFGDEVKFLDAAGHRIWELAEIRELHGDLLRRPPRLILRLRERVPRPQPGA